MRRRAADLSIEQVAATLGGKLYVRHLRAIETPGLRLRQIADLSIVMPFSADVYRQLADLPPHQHPPLCARCGWDAHTDQADRLDALTTWSRETPGICTRCEQDEQALDARRCA
jgi:hypothetical protein